MRILYNFILWVFRAGYYLASFFQLKAKSFFEGRKHLLIRIRQIMNGLKDPIVWIHCASLGEFEQGRPVLEKLKEVLPDHKILLTFFSPSGYEVRKNYAKADWVFYIPFDLPKHARIWVGTVKPVLAIFVKYEFWPNLFAELGKQNVPIISVSSIFRPEQIYFKRYGKLMRETLQTVNYFFVQNDRSARLLASIGINQVSVSGDTRFDRVFQITQSSEENTVARAFKNNQKCLVVGSCWPEDIETLSHFINASKGRLKFIIAPHEIDEVFIAEIIQSLEVTSVRYSHAESDWENADVLIVDNVGMLSSLYRYGEFAWVGGAYGKGLHNILEAACYGIPVFFGNKNYERFQEAVDLIDQGGAFAIADFVEMKQQYEALSSIPENYIVACNASRNYVEINLGATDKIVKYCQSILKT